MQYINYYNSPIGRILLTSDGTALTGLFLEGEAWDLSPCDKKEDLSVFQQTKAWLDIYFSGDKPDFTPEIHTTGTEFQEEVWSILKTIPYGETMTYGDIAKSIAASRGISRMSAQAVGGAVGSNPISIIVPCHRVLGSGGKLTGFASGLDNKIALLKTEKILVD